MVGQPLFRTRFVSATLPRATLRVAGLALLLLFLAASVPAAFSQLYISEILLNPPGSDSTNEYIELRGQPNALIADGKEGQRGVNLCRQAANDGDVGAQAFVANAYFSGSGVKQDHAQARKFYEMAAKQKDLDSARRLGEMYARGDGGKKDTKKALEIWTASEKAGDPLVSILVADQLFSEGLITHAG